MYSFIDIREPTPSVAPPSDDLLINGRSLSDVIEGYRQLTVTGRGLVGRVVTTTDIPAKRGVWVDSAKDDKLELTISYQLVATSSEELRRQFTLLNTILRGDEDGKLTFSFADDSNYHYEGYLSGVEATAEDRLTIVSSFTLLVPDPYRKGSKQSVTNGKVSLTYANQVLPVSILATVTQNASELEVFTDRSRIKFVGNYAVGKTLVITWLEDEITCHYDGRSILSELAHLSVPESFYLRDGDVVKGKNLTITKVEWRDEKL